MPTPAPKPSKEELVRARAYQFWIEEGRPEGRADIHWQRALDSVAAETIPDVKPVKAAPAAAAPLKTAPAKKAPARKAVAKKK
jgi:hypothetical protein